MHWLLSFLLVGASAFAGSKNTCDKLIWDEDLFRAQLSRENVLSTAQAAQADIRPVQVYFPGARPYLKYIPILNSRLSKSGLLVISPEGRPMVWAYRDDELSQVDPVIDADAEVWEGEVRRLLVVAGDWDWVGTPPPRRHTGDMSLSDFVATYADALEPLLLSGELTQADVLGALAFRGRLGDAELTFLVKAHQDSFSPDFIYAFDAVAPFADRRDLLDGALVRDVPFAEVGARKHRLARRDQGTFTLNAPYHWAPPVGAGERALRDARDPEWIAFLKTFAGAVDDLLMREDAPAEAKLPTARVLPVTRTSDGGGRYFAVLIAKVRGDLDDEDVWIFDPSTGKWVGEGALAPGDAFIFEDGRRFGLRTGHARSEWLGRTDALARLKEAVKAR